MVGQHPFFGERLRNVLSSSRQTSHQVVCDTSYFQIRKLR